MSIQDDDDAAAAVAVAPRVTLGLIESKIAQAIFFTGDQAAGFAGAAVDSRANLKSLTICMLVMDNGFVVIGKSAPASPENFNAELGQRFAREDAIRQVWALEGYSLRNALSASAIIEESTIR